MLLTILFSSPLQEEKRKAMANEFVAKLTDVCWDKCITGSIGSSFSNSEASCLSISSAWAEFSPFSPFLSAQPKSKFSP